MPTYSDEEYIRLLQEAHKRVDGPLTVSEFNDMDDMPSHVAIHKRFGSWNEAKEKAGINQLKRGMTKYASTNVTFSVDKKGHVRIRVQEGGVNKRFKHHRLLATLKYELDEMRDKVVHHRNHIPWDNRLENLQLMGHGEHTAYHNRNR